MKDAVKERWVIVSRVVLAVGKVIINHFGEK